MRSTECLLVSECDMWVYHTVSIELEKLIHVYLLTTDKCSRDGAIGGRVAGSNPRRCNHLRLDTYVSRYHLMSLIETNVGGTDIDAPDIETSVPLKQTFISLTTYMYKVFIKSI